MTVTTMHLLTEREWPEDLPIDDGRYSMEKWGEKPELMKNIRRKDVICQLQLACKAYGTAAAMLEDDPSDVSLLSLRQKALEYIEKYSKMYHIPIHNSFVFDNYNMCKLQLAKEATGAQDSMPIDIPMPTKSQFKEEERGYRPLGYLSQRMRSKSTANHKNDTDDVQYKGHFKPESF